MSQNKYNEIEKINLSGKKTLILIGIAFLILIGFYFFWFGIILKLPLTQDPAYLGTFGDYIGGILNPFIALFACYWLISSIKSQVKELNDSRDQFEKVSKKQQEQIALQNFEGLFFHLLNTKQQEIEQILVGNKNSLELFSINNPPLSLESKDFLQSNLNADKSKLLQGKESIKFHLIFFKKFWTGTWQDFYKNNLLDYMGSYFRVCYQIVKLIEENDILKSYKKIEGKNYSAEQKKYFDIFRATLSQYELEAFFFNCLSDYGRHKFKRMVEDYGIFEPILVNYIENQNLINPLTRYAYQYNAKAFENNEQFKYYFEVINELYELPREILAENYSKLYKLNILTPMFPSESTTSKLQHHFEDYFRKILFKFNDYENIKVFTSLEKYITSLIEREEKKIEMNNLEHIECQKEIDKDEHPLHYSILTDKRLNLDMEIRTSNQLIFDYKDIQHLTLIEFLIDNKILIDEFEKFRNEQINSIA